MTANEHPIQTTRTELTPSPARHYDPVGAIRSAAHAPMPYGDDTIARVAWSVIIEPGDIEAGAFINTFGPVGALELVLNAPSAETPDRLTHLAATQYNPRRVARHLDTAHTHGHTILTPEADQWPSRLALLGDAMPLLLWCNGTPDALNADHVTAITGSRAASTYGEHVATTLATDLVHEGHAIVTGAGYGIDGAATRATLAAEGTAVVVLAAGVDRPYPAAHKDLIARVAAGGGAVVSELVPGTSPTRWRFLQRSGIIAALGEQLIIVEAGTRSGALHTAGHANRIGTPVYAIPGPVTSPTSAGCHALIRDERARLISSASEIVS